MSRPPYVVPTMASIAELPPNGLTVATTFGGCGGSSTGYRMAGFRVVWANEFAPDALECYRANAAPGTVLDGRDIREISGESIREAVGEVDVLDGSPPCTPFSTQGTRTAGWGVERADSAGIVQRIDDLFLEYARLVGELRPRVFVAENVAGLVRGTAKGYFKLIIRELRAAGYRVEARLLDASWLDVPQARQRVIIVGVREDLAADPAFPAPLPYRRTIGDALGPTCAGLIQPAAVAGNSIWSGHGVISPHITRPMSIDPSRPAMTIQTGYTSHSELALLTSGPVIDRDPETGQDLQTGMHRWAGAPRSYGTQYRRLTLAELRRLAGFPADFILTGSYPQRWKRIGNAVPPVMMSAIATVLRDRVLGELAVA